MPAGHPRWLPPTLRFGRPTHFPQLPRQYEAGYQQPDQGHVVDDVEGGVRSHSSDRQIEADAGARKGDGLRPQRGDARRRRPDEGQAHADQQDHRDPALVHRRLIERAGNHDAGMEGRSHEERRCRRGHEKSKVTHQSTTFTVPTMSRCTSQRKK